MREEPGWLPETAEDPLLPGLAHRLRLLVVGASGLLGSQLVPRLLARGHRVVGLARSGPPPSLAGHRRLSWRRANVTDARSLEGAAEDCEVVVQLAGRRCPSTEGRDLDVDGTRNLVAEARRRGVRRMVFVSALGAARQAGAIHRSKREAERLVLSSGLETVIFRPTVLVGQGDPLTEALAAWLRRWPLLTLPGGREGTLRPVAVEDAAEALCQGAERDALAGRIFPLVGPRPTPVLEAARFVAALLDLRRIVLPVPPSLGDRCFTAMARTARRQGLPWEGWELLRWCAPVDAPPGAEDIFRNVFRIEPMPFGEAVGGGV